MTLTFTVVGTNDTVALTDFDLVVAGYTGRDEASVKKHIDELAAIGVAPPETVPAFYELPASLATQVFAPVRPRSSRAQRAAQSPRRSPNVRRSSLLRAQKFSSTFDSSHASIAFWSSRAPRDIYSEAPRPVCKPCRSKAESVHLNISGSVRK